MSMKPVLALFAMGLLASSASAQTHADIGGTIIPAVAPLYLYKSAGAAQMGLSVVSATGLTAPGGATIAQICVENANVRYRDDGTAPTASSGMPVTAGSCFAYSGPLSVVQFIAQAGSPILDVSFYK